MSVFEDAWAPIPEMPTPTQRREVKNGSGEDTPFHMERNKDRVELLPKSALRRVAGAFAYGVQKYGPWNWIEYATEWEWLQLIGSAERHLFSWECRQDIDPESACHHLDMAIANLLMLRTLILRGTGKDNREPR
jgi:hypothetical protein